MIDPVALTAALVACPSVTPRDAGALDVLQKALEGLGFACTRLPFEAPGPERVDNLYARLGEVGPVFGYAGHTDVVPVGDAGAWTHDPFAGDISEGALHGRGASDMKGAIAAFVAAVDNFLRRRKTPLKGSIALLITGDEEGPGLNGTAPMLRWLADRGEIPDVCLVGEPSNDSELGDAIKIGRRGSLNGRISVLGRQGHTAFPHRADNPLPDLLALLDRLRQHELDTGTEHFPPSNLEITSVDVANPAFNIIPARAEARFNIRFNDRHDGDSLCHWLRQEAAAMGREHELDLQVTAEAFLTPPGPLSRLITQAVQSVTGRAPTLATTGGTSDARFIKDYCPVVEFGLVNETIHQVDEYARLADIERLSDIYAAVLDGFFTR